MAIFEIWEGETWVDRIIATDQEAADAIAGPDRTAVYEASDQDRKDEIATRTFRDAVNAERARRLDAGCDVQIPSTGTWVALQGRDEDKITLLGLALRASQYAAFGDLLHPMPFMDRNNVLHTLTPNEILEMQAAGAAYVEAVYAASWTLKSADPRPEHPTSDQYWPAQTIQP